MIHLPFINKYPYTSMEAVNIDWLLNQVSRIPVLEEKVNQHEERITIAEGEIDELQATAEDHETRLTAAEADIEDLKPRVAANETEIAGLKTRLTGDEALISALQTEGSQQGVRITTLENQMSTAQSDIIVLQTENQAQENDIDALDSRVTTLEGHSVIANPGGSGANLNTLSVDGTTYVIPSGGGGSGTTVTPNPAGVLPTDPELSALGIDALNYRIPVTAADKAAIEGDISDLQVTVSELEDAVLDIDTRIGTVIQKTRSAISIPPAVSTGEVIELTNAYVGVDMGLLLPPGVYQVSFSCDFDTTNYGSTPRFLGCYIRDLLHTNLARDKFSVFGTERAMITQAASVQCTTVITVTGTGMQLNPAIRCNSSKANTGFAITDVEFTAVRLGVVS